MKPAIVYLAQNTPRDLQHGRDSRSLLEKSLDLLYANYNDQFRHDILIFHEGDFTPGDQAEIARGRKEISFKDIRFSTPDFLPKDEIPEVWDDGRGGARFGMGHRHMIRFYAVRLFDLLEEMGYDWFFRMDDDSFFHSKIDYNLFEFMERHGYEYGYRANSQEPVKCAWGFGEALQAYVKAEHITPTFLNEHFTPAPWKVHLGNLVKSCLMRAFPKGRRYVMAPSAEYDLWGYYNNFFITRIGWWKQPQVQRFIHYFDRLGGWYKYRWNDLIFQSAAVQIFLAKDKLYKFTDWTYEHATIKNGRLIWGGIYPGTKDADSPVVREFVKTYGFPRAPLKRTY